MSHDDEIFISIPETAEEQILWDKIHKGILQLPPQAKGCILWEEMKPYLHLLEPGPNASKAQSDSEGAQVPDPNAGPGFGVQGRPCG